MTTYNPNGVQPQSVLECAAFVLPPQSVKRNIEKNAAHFQANAPDVLEFLGRWAKVDASRAQLRTSGHITTLFDALALLPPPIALIEHLARYGDRLPADAHCYLLLWQAIRAGEPVPELDRFSRKEE